MCEKTYVPNYSMLAYESVQSCDLGIPKASKCYGLLMSLILVSAMLTYVNLHCNLISYNLLHNLSTVPLNIKLKFETDGALYKKKKTIVLQTF